jgi:hypothetical protein
MLSDAAAGLGEDEPLRPQPQPRFLLELARSFVVLPRHEQEAFGELVRVLAAVDAGLEREEGGDGRAGADPGATRRGAH